MEAQNDQYTTDTCTCVFCDIFHHLPTERHQKLAVAKDKAVHLERHHASFRFAYPFFFALFSLYLSSLSFTLGKRR